MIAEIERLSEVVISDRIILDRAFAYRCLRLVCTRYDEKEGMEVFLQKFNEIFNALTDYKMPIHESVLCILMLQGLSKSYDAYITAIESRDEIPKFSLLRSKLIDEQLKN